MKLKKAYVSREVGVSWEERFLGYANNLDDLKAPDKIKGQLKTGDLAYRDEDGFYYISGRKKELLK